MKLRYVLTAVIALAALSVASWFSGPSTVQAQANLLTNPGFEAGHYNQDGIPEITVPNGWRMHWLDGIPFNNSNGNAARPETVVWNIQDAPPNERPLFFRDGSYTLKIFKGWAPMYAAVSQDVTGLEVGRRYRLSAPIFVDIVESYDNGKQAPGKLDSGQVRLGAGNTGTAWRDASNIQYSPWWTAGNVPSFYLANTTFSHEFTATSPNMTVWIEVASIDPYINNGFFMDGLSLVALEGTAPVAPPPPAAGGGTGSGSAQQPPAPTAPPPPTPTPRADGAVVHVVQPGDSFWGLAIQYANVMQLSPEEAVRAIQERNNNPTVINPGQELIIVPPNSSAAIAPPSVEEEPEVEAEAEADSEAVEEDVVVTEEPETPAATEETTSAISGICVNAYHDLNGDGARDPSSEPLLANAAITVFQGGRTVASYVTDGGGADYCFENLPPDTYQVQVFPPAGYQATTPESWAIVVAEGVVIPVAFGLQEAPETVAMVSDATPVDEGETASVEETAVSPDPAPESSGGGLASISGIILIGAAILVMLAGVGVYLLRRG